MSPSLAIKGNNVDHESNPEIVEKWFHDHIQHHAKPKLTKLHFFVHDNVTADNPTSVLIAPANTDNFASIAFGSTYAMDAPITVDSDPSSKLIGRAQGTFTFAGQAEPVSSMVINLVFTEGDFKGSSLSILGNKPNIS
ncbi:OLC1v1035966C1 [Oldenlandia corymbosa var. corymbosa]|uniref:Dirigent protein n=1 Tax=Oldenlandia corymbosa var. corymbosa TaxID=529605 RepID=A0AAV1CXE4_OLDCO|nr:OLC1v1035966C1 [Oldenlandia corymbosa var. corymbosa]